MLVLSISLASNIYAQEGINFSLGTGTSLLWEVEKIKNKDG